jgi:hypothetical protein
MNVGQLKKVLKAAANQYREAGKTEIAGGLSDLATNLLKDKDSETVAAFVKRVEKGRNPPAPKPKASKSRKK